MSGPNFWTGCTPARESTQRFSPFRSSITHALGPGAKPTRPGAKSAGARHARARGALERAGLRRRDLDALFVVSITGIASPSLDARLINLLRLRSDIKRTPIFGVGCVGGALGLTRAADYALAYPGQTAALLSVESCSLTFQRDDPCPRT